MGKSHSGYSLHTQQNQLLLFSIASCSCLKGHKSSKHAPAQHLQLKRITSVGKIAHFYQSTKMALNFITQIVNIFCLNLSLEGTNLYLNIIIY